MTETAPPFQGADYELIIMDLFEYAATQKMDIERARHARDTGIEKTRASNDNWHDSALEDFLAYLRRGPSLTEEWRASYVRRGLPEPKSPNAWGAVVRSAVSKGLIEAVAFAQSKSVKSHAHFYRKWRLKAT